MGAAELVAWYRGARRDLPWRRREDAYGIWVSEVMLQQTRVEHVLRYYEPFLQAFPSVAALAAADLDEVLARWSGLGYYRRARQMHAAAQQLAADGGELPESAAALRELPGFGPYTAAAVASIAFGEPVVVLDGNVARVAARFSAYEGEASRAAGRRHLHSVLERLFDPATPGDSNQALMELGATVCTPRRPRCDACPLEPECAGAAGGSPERYPRPAKRRPPRRVRRTVAVARRDGRVLLYRRPEGSRVLAGTWELPWSDAATPAAAERSLARRYGGRWRLGEVTATVRHAITSRSFELEARGAELELEDVAEGREAGWFESEELDALPVSSAVRKVLSAVPLRPPGCTSR